MLKRYSIYFLLISLLLSCSEKAVKTEKVINKKTAELESLFNYLFENKIFNGAVAVKDSGKIIFKETYGYANFETEEPFTSHTQMELASVSKQFTAAAIMKLHQQNKIDLNADINTYFEPDLPYNGVKVYNLLNHTAGLPNYEPWFKENWPEETIAYNKDIVKYFIEHKPDTLFAPGKGYHYSNTGYILLAELVHITSGKPLDQFLQEELFNPFILTESGFYGRDDIFDMKAYAPAFMWDIEKCAYVRPETLAEKSYYYFLSGRFGSGRLSSSLDNLISWDSLLYTDSFLADTTKALIFTPNPDTSLSTDYGFGWHVYNDDVKGKVAYHTGNWAGNLAYIKRYMNDGSLVVLLNNTYESKYMKSVRNAIDAILKEEEWQYPKILLSEKLKKDICTENFDPVKWSSQFSDTIKFEHDLKRNRKAATRIIINK
ncbi:MAG: penicillin-binding protein [Thalassobius sp.]|nr:penicillin-binding protein [Thalassovita sp.]